VSRRPLRIQHRSGSAWLLNGAALAALGIPDAAPADPSLPPGLERDERGRPTGRLFRGDAWLRERLGGEPPDLAAVGARLASFGITGVTDATAHNDAAALARFVQAEACGALPQALRVMGMPGMPASDAARVTRGEVKVLLDEPRLPDFDALCARIRTAHAESRGVAIHCVTRAEAVFAVEALREAGARPGDRLEHAAVAPPELVGSVAALGIRVVTQPHFLCERGDAYLEDVAPGDVPWLYRGRAWRKAGVPLAGGSDAPFGAPDPWRAMAAAVARRSARLSGRACAEGGGPGKEGVGTATLRLLLESKRTPIAL
jgi:predicted amidohydrolase YtcJ